MAEKEPATQGADLFVVDNSDDEWKVLQYLREWAEIANRFDIATGTFEIGGLLALDGRWQKLDKVRILMGAGTTMRTRRALLEGLREQVSADLDRSIESEKEQNDFLVGVPAIVEALRTGQIKCRVYTKDKFHAKAYITHGKHAVVGSTALVGSSNLTLPGLTKNVELNIQVRREVETLQQWYEKHWNDAQDVTPLVLEVIDRHIREYTPFTVYAKALQEFFRGHMMTASEWELAGGENGGSRMYAVLDQYQKDGYQSVMKIARQYGGAFLCDGVGLGKTYIGLMAIERLVIHDRKRVVLFVPKAARVPVWERALKKYLSHVGGLGGGDFSNLVILNHTDLGRGGEFPDRFKRILELADAFVIDEAHHFRNPGIKGTGERTRSRYRLLYDLVEGANGRKQLYMLTATPINNKLDDFRHMTELFTRQQQDYFASTVGIHSLRGHFRSMEKALRRAVEGGRETDDPTETDLAEAEQVLTADALFQALVVQRSRAYVRESQLQQGATAASFPTREPPKVIDYSVKKTYGRLLALVETAFEKETPLFVLSTYYPLAYYKGPDKSIKPLEEGRQKQVVSLIRTQFLKRFESSAHAFEMSCDRLLGKLLAWATRHSETDAEKRRLEIWRRRNAELIDYARARQMELFGGEEEEDADEDFVTPEMLEAVDLLSRDEYDVEAILSDTYMDLDQVADFLRELRKFKPRNDDKLKALVKLLKGDPVLSEHKVLIFTEFAETARYVCNQLREAEIAGVEEIDSGRKGHDSILRRFAPYYNESSSADLSARREEEIRILISTDVLSEGLNLQDATRLINYDLHWNPVRLMQRIGRVDRRMDPKVEEQLVADHPQQKDLRGKVAYWNFLPPDELEELLRLYRRVSHKTLLISKTFGIEGKKLLRPEDDFDALRNFNHQYEGDPTPVEKMRLEYQALLNEHPGLSDMLDGLPGRVLSGKQHPSPDARGVFFCYALPALDKEACEFTEEAGTTRWYLYDLDRDAILEEPAEIIGSVRSKPDTPRRCTTEEKTLVELRAKVEKHIKNTYLKRVDAPIGVKPSLKCWMELNEG